MRGTDLTGKRFGRLVAVEIAERATHGSKLKWLCRCDCGEMIVVNGGNLRRGVTRSCGCIRVEHPNRLSHGMRHSPEYATWSRMWQRCTNSKNPKYKDYGARGIVPDEAFRDFAVWFAEVGPRPSTKHSLDRIKNNLGYVKGNMRWATAKQQGRNQRDNHLVTFDGQTMCLAAWEEETGIPDQVICGRLHLGWDVERALTEPVQNWGNHRTTWESKGD